MIIKYIIPDMNTAIDNFKNAIETAELSSVPSISTSAAPAITTSSDEIECPNCHTKLSANSKFCLECGSKIEIKKTIFCTQCGESITAGAKFCASCGAKI